jgi:hypothetical protein
VDKAKHSELPLDVDVARAKFEAELALYRAEEAAYHTQGCWLLSASFPKAIFAFAHPGLKPNPVILGAQFDFSNYDLWPISVRFLDPFTRIPYPPRGLPTVMLRRTQPGPVPSGAPLIVFHSDEDTPFLCLPGVREYHNHPAHTGDSWFLHRGKAEGTLAHLLSVITLYGVTAIKTFNFGLNISINGFQVDAPL